MILSAKWSSHAFQMSPIQIFKIQGSWFWIPIWITGTSDSLADPGSSPWHGGKDELEEIFSYWWWLKSGKAVDMLNIQCLTSFSPSRLMHKFIHSITILSGLVFPCNCVSCSQRNQKYVPYSIPKDQKTGTVFPIPRDPNDGPWGCWLEEPNSAWRFIELGL